MKHRVAGAPLDFAALRSELEVPGDFASDVLAEAERAAEAPPEAGHVDATDIPFVTVDPTGSRDLDQAVHLSRDGAGFVVRYAIADVAAVVTPGAPLDLETHRRGQTLYFPDVRVPLHPPRLSEDAASLLPGAVRAAVLWTIRLGADGGVLGTDVRRALVRSTAQLDYVGVQAQLDAGTLPEALTPLREIGEARQAQARSRHAVDLDLPEQEVHTDGNGGWTIELRDQLPVERYNAEISLLTGMCAAAIMLEGGVGLLRTVPPADPRTVDTLRRAALALGVDWPKGAHAGDVLARLDRTNPRQVALLEHAGSLLRGSSYTPFDGTAPEQALHSGIGAPYAHVTAPLRRLVDRYGSEICLALHAGAAVPPWARAGLAALPDQMHRTDQLAHQVDRAVVDATEAWLLRDRVGSVFPAVVIDADAHAGTVVLDDPAVRARCRGDDLPVGERIEVLLTAADVEQRTVTFERAT